MSQIIKTLTAGGVIPPNIPTTFQTSNNDGVPGTINGSATPAANTLTVNATSVETDNVDGLQAAATGSTIVYELTNRIKGSGITTDGATPVTLMTFPLGAVPGTYVFEQKVAAYNVTSSLSAGYVGFAAVRTNGAAGFLLSFDTGLVDEEGVMSGVTVANNIIGNNLVLTATGLAGSTINYVALTEYIFAS